MVKFFWVFVFILLLTACGQNSELNQIETPSVITVVDQIDIGSLEQAHENSIVIDAAYDDITHVVELLVCIPKPRHALSDVEAIFSFGFYDNGTPEGTMLVSKSVPSAIDGDFDTLMLRVNSEFLSKLYVHMNYSEAERFKAVGETPNVFTISFLSMAERIVQNAQDINQGRDPLRAPPLPTCL